MAKRISELGSPPGVPVDLEPGDLFEISRLGEGEDPNQSLPTSIEKIKAAVGDISAAVLAALAFGPFTAIASAATTDLSSVATIGVSITGTTTITSFGAGANLLRIGKFAGALTLTHNATSLILPGAANITTAAGDRFIALSDGSGNWTVIDYIRADGKPVAPVTGKRLKGIVRILSSTTYNVPAGVTALLVRGVGGGGGGGGATQGSGQTKCGGGGGGGAYGEVWVSSPAGSYAITIGAAGAAGNTSGGNGGTGGATSVGSILNLGGGVGGNGRNSVAYPTITIGGTGGSVTTGGDFSHAGEDGAFAFMANENVRYTGAGGVSPFGSGGGGRANTVAANAGNGFDGNGHGSGGGGGFSGTSTNASGGAGTAGYVEIWEYVDW